MAKVCNKCERTLPESAFYRHPNHRDGLSYSCKECVAQYNQARWVVQRENPAILERHRENGRLWHERNRDRSLARTARNHRKEREEVIQAYGGTCACCGEACYEFLALDHIDGGGHQHRIAVGGKMARWLKLQGFPPDARIRVLCHNCNSALAYYGYCPHDGMPESSVAS